MPSELPAPQDIFTCRQCGDCCKGYGGTFVTRQDVENIAAYLQMDPGRFIEACCQRSGRGLVLAQQKNGYCIFWDKNCTIHALKPKMCKSWPFIHSVLIDVENWQIMGADCPGMVTDVPDEDVRAFVRKVLQGQAEE